MSRSPGLPTLALRRKDQLEALTSPIRIEIVDWLQSEGPQSIQEIATGLDRAPSSLYYHIDKLASVGLVETKDVRPGRTRSAKVYELVAQKLDVPPSARRSAAVLADMSDAVLRKASREYRRALKDTKAPMPRVARMRGRVSARARAEIERHLVAIQRIFLEERRKKSSGIALSCTAILASFENNRDKS